MHAGQVTYVTEEGADGNGSVLQGEIGCSATFLLGARSQKSCWLQQSVIVLRRLSLHDPR